MGIEFDALRPDRDRKVQATTQCDKLMEIVPCAQISVIVNWVAIAPEAEMFQRMQTGGGITIIPKSGVVCHKIGLNKTNRMHGVSLWSNVDHFDFAKCSDVRNESIDPGTNVNVFFRPIFRKPSCYEQVLMKVVSSGCATVRESIVIAWRQSVDRKLSVR